MIPILELPVWADWVFKGIGILGQSFFFLRFLVQWTMSEAARKIVVPRSFWKLSIGGAVCNLIYSIYEKEIVFLIAPAINLFIYGRNISLSRRSKSLSKEILQPMFAGILSVALVAMVFAEQFKLRAYGDFWLAVGLLGQALWTARFPVQWYHSERARKVLLPPSFFAASLAGSILLLAFAIRTGKPIFIAGMVLGPLLYSRSLILALRTRDGRREGGEA